ncbi:ABC transporter ATP-binding protein [Dissulfurirhabdus thermomarina]|uniref:ABC transporter ATP-binding protein n=1 Tax=Dissulfurirhabdus thermomarina TaxID=1765737 RepID=A0A6N9TQ25_DISTH|nr:ABC transporter ATP-binding protein [Dissulfurirhabdus thermomarina]NDY42550.1 ABC transporter ATP-binding protein [Dissulfurirhabdus thermomarina]NMX23691.1 ABC transporter ATP-binding protein [Dissulfurirhabdus thermomarina]
MLQVEDLWVDVQGKEVLKGINLHIGTGETHCLFGKNGSGKTTLLMTLMGFSGYRVKHGRIRFKGEDITHWPTNERARLGLGISFQRPPTLRGVKLRDLLAYCGGAAGPAEELAEAYRFEHFLDREVNLGFSGGEIKKSELLQLLAQDPDLTLLDEPESGVDVENLQVIGDMIRRLLQKDRHRGREKSGLIITHTGFILNYVTADRGHVMMNGQIYCQGNPLEIFEGIQQHGYEECIRCRR